MIYYTSFHFCLKSWNGTFDDLRKAWIQKKFGSISGLPNQSFMVDQSIAKVQYSAGNRKTSFIPPLDMTFD